MDFSPRARDVGGPPMDQPGLGGNGGGGEWSRAQASCGMPPTVVYRPLRGVGTLRHAGHSLCSSCGGYACSLSLSLSLSLSWRTARIRSLGAVVRLGNTGSRRSMRFGISEKWPFARVNWVAALVFWTNIGGSSAGTSVGLAAGHGGRSGFGPQSMDAP